MRKIYDFVLKVAAILCVLASVLLLDGLFAGEMPVFINLVLLASTAGASAYFAGICLRRERAAARRVRKAKQAAAQKPVLYAVGPRKGPGGPHAA